MQPVAKRGDVGTPRHAVELRRQRIDLGEQQATQRGQDRRIAADRGERARIVEWNIAIVTRRGTCVPGRGVTAKNVAQDADAERLDDDIGESGRDQCTARVVVRVRRRRDGRGIARRTCFGADAREGRGTVEPRHARIEQEQIEPSPLCLRNRVGAVVRQRVRRAKLRQRFGEEAQRHRIVVGYENVGHTRGGSMPDTPEG